MENTRYKTSFSDEEIISAIIAVRGIPKVDLVNNLQPPNLRTFFLNLPKAEQVRLLSGIELSD